MERNRSETSKNKGFYIAVCCCVLVIAIVGYVSWFAGDSKNELQNAEKSPENKISDVENISEIPKVQVKEEKKVPERQSVPAEEKTAAASKNVYAEDNTPALKSPVSGKVIGKFSGENLVFHKELSDWRSHNGVDFKAKEGDKVLASADGVVESVYSDSMGNCIVIDHENGIKTLYANLSDSDLDLSGQNVRQGDEIGTVGNSALADLTQESHLHFEVLKDDKPVDPMEYLK